MKILALDLATITGAAVGCAGDTPHTWTVNLGVSLPHPRRYARALRMTRVCIEKHKPDLVVVEAAVGGPKASQYLVGLLACVQGQCADLGVPCETHHLASVRKHFLGANPSLKQFKGNRAQQQKQVKALVLNRCRSLGWPVEDDNCADAAALWDYAQAVRNPVHAVQTVGGIFR